MQVHKQCGRPQGNVHSFLVANWPQANQELFGWSDPKRWQKRYITLRAEVAGEIAGVAQYWQMGGVGYLSQLLVATRFRGQGVGSRLLATFEDDCRQHCHKLALKTYKDSSSQRFYQRFNWKVESVLNNDVHGIDWVYMCKEEGQ